MYLQNLLKRENSFVPELYLNYYQTQESFVFFWGKIKLVDDGLRLPMSLIAENLSISLLQGKGMDKTDIWLCV